MCFTFWGKYDDILRKINFQVAQVSETLTFVFMHFLTIVQGP